MKLDKNIILQEANLQQTLQLYKDKIPEDVLTQVIQADPTAKLPNYIGNYAKWLIKNVLLKERIPIEDLYKATEYLTLFDKIKGKLPVEQRDLNKIQDLKDLFRIVEPYGDYKSKREIEYGTKVAGAEKVYEDADWLVVIPRTKEASCYYGAHTQWCTASEQNNYFDSYSEKGPLYIFINKKTNNKWQFHYETGSFMNEKDNDIDYDKFKKEVPKTIQNVILALEGEFAKRVIFKKDIESIRKTVLDFGYRAKNKNLNTLKSLLRYDLDPNIIIETEEKNDDINHIGDTLLHAYARLMEYDFCEVMIKNGANTNAKNKKGETPLIALFSKLGSRSYFSSEFIDKFLKISTLLLNNKANPNITDINGFGPIHYLFISEKPQDDFYSQILSLLKEHKTQIDSRGQNNVTSLHLSIMKKLKATTLQLINMGANTNIICKIGGLSFNALTLFLYYYKKESIVDEKNRALFDILLEKNKNINEPKSLPPIVVLFKYYSNLYPGEPTSYFNKIMEKNPKLNLKKDNPLGVVATEGDVTIFDILISKGADINTRDILSTGYSPLMYAVENNNYSIVRKLIKLGAKLNFISRNGKTAMDLASDENVDEKVREILIRNGAKKADELVKKENKSVSFKTFLYLQ